MSNQIDYPRTKPILFTGITPTGTLTLGHYLGVIRHLTKLQDKYQIFLMIADLHALTTSQVQNTDYKQNGREIAAPIYACGVRQDNCHIFIQSQIKEHVELSYLLAAYCTVSKLTNMIQYKEKKLEKQSAAVALLYYPVLMAADILLYDVDLVIVGQDQKQHLELTSYLANKFNANNEQILKTPEFSIASFGSKIMSFKNPTKKMSKSSGDYLAILDDEDSIKRKIMRAETDSEEKVYYNPVKKPGISNLLTIYACFAELTIEQVEKNFETASYAELKNALFEVVSHRLLEIQANFRSHYHNIEQVIATSNDHLASLARTRMQKIKKEVGL